MRPMDSALADEICTICRKPFRDHRVDSSEEDPPICSPLCGASKAYGRSDEPWKHESLCPVHQAWDIERGKSPSY